jgi:hypothetical protein
VFMITRNLASEQRLKTSRHMARITFLTSTRAHSQELQIWNWARNWRMAPHPPHQCQGAMRSTYFHIQQWRIQYHRRGDMKWDEFGMPGWNKCLGFVLCLAMSGHTVWCAEKCSIALLQD